MSINLFGPPQITRGKEQISIQRRKDLALLIYLVSTSQPQSRDTLATLLWQDQTQTDARSNLRKSLSRLKSMLGEDALFISQNQAGLNPKFSIRLDTAQFDSHINRFRQHGHVKKANHPHLCGECQNTLEEAARLYRADFLQGFSLPDSPVFEEWQFFQSESLRKNLSEILEHLTLQFTFAGNHSLAIEHCRRWLSLDRLHEPPHRQLMLLYALSGQQSAALRQFDEFARLLRNELGAEPEIETINLYEAIQKKKLGEMLKLKSWGSISLPISQNELTTPLQTKQELIRNLPIHPGLFVGREKELNEIFRILREDTCQLLTLQGPGGSGKTRLALQVASTVHTSPNTVFKDGAAFIPLAPVTDTKSLVGAMGEGLGITGHVIGTDDRQKLLSHLHGRQMLLVIDNFEHLLGEDSIRLMSAILEVAPLSKILITSRERLNVKGEYIFRVEGLETPTYESLHSKPLPDSVLSAFSALQLFEQCASRIDPSFKITRENFLPVAEICRNVQGMPLAIELAAAWLEVFSPEEINQEIRRSLDFLQGNWRDLPDRQRSLRAVFDSSWALLDKQVRPVVKALSVFRTSFTREAAQAVSGASAKSLLDLTNKSWIQKLSDGRYQIHELLKQFVYEKLAREESTVEQVKNQYCEYYASYTHSLWEAMKGSSQRWAYTGIEVEFENIQTAWDWLVSRKKCEIIAHRILPVLLHFAEIRGKNAELLNMLEAAIHSVNTSGKDRRQPTVEIILLTAQGAFFQDAYPLRYSIHDAIFPINTKGIEQAWKQAKASIELHELAFWGILLAYIYGRLLNLKEGIRQLKRMIPYFQQDNQHWERGIAYLHLLKLMIPNREKSSDQVDLLTDYLSRAMEIFDALGDRINAGQILNLWGVMKYMELDMEGAIQHWNSARTLFLSVDEWGSATTVLWQLCDAYLQSGNFPKAFACCQEMANVYMQHGLRHLAVGALSKESYEKSRYGNLAEALQIRRQCIDIIQETGPEYQIAWNYWEMGELIRISGNLSDATGWFERSREGFEKAHDNIGRSFYHRGMGDIAMARGEFEAARLHFLESSKFSRIANHTWMIAYTVSGLGRSELGLEHLVLAQKHLRDALRAAVKTRDQGITLVVLTAYADLLRQQGRLEKGVQFASLASSHVSTWHETRKQAVNLLAVLKTSMPAAKFLQAKERGNLIDLRKLADSLTKKQ